MSSTISTPFLPPLPTPQKNKTTPRRRPPPPSIVMAARRDRHDYNNGRLVDENMIVLRKRIHEMKIIERNYEPPAEWMEWEKNYYANYDSIICDAMGILQKQLMNTRPSFALGIMGLIALSVPISSSIVIFHFLEFSNSFLALGGH